MRLRQILFAIVFFPSILYAQHNYKQGSFVVKGHVKNAKKSFIDFGLTTFFMSSAGSIVIKPGGIFQQTIPVQHSQNFYLTINNELLVFRVFDKDTLNLDWDDSDFSNSFSVSGKNSLRTNELQVQWKLNSKFFAAHMNLLRNLAENSRILSDEKKFELINEMYNRQVKAVLDSAGPFSKTLNYLITDLYFQYTIALQNFRLIPKFQLKLNLDSSTSYPYFDLKNQSLSYAMLNEDWFWNAPEYRNFIFDYVRYYKPFNSWRSVTPAVEKAFNPSLDDYYSAQANINLINIKDWFITQSIMFGFEHYLFSDVEKVYQQFIPDCKSAYLKDTLQKYYAAIKRLRPGSPAPGFTLKNDKGQMVSLSNFNGKVVYIDFWGANCGPCINDIEKHVPQLHNKYKDKDLVFINICVDSKESEWKEAIAKYKLEGINLIAEGWTSHPVCKAYNVQGLPHYVLVDKAGKISNNNAPRASQLDRDKNNEIDVLLK